MLPQPFNVHIFTVLFTVPAKVWSLGDKVVLSCLVLYCITLDSIAKLGVVAYRVVSGQLEVIESGCLLYGGPSAGID